MKNNKWYFTTTSIVFTVVAIAHLGRIILVMPIVIAGYDIPLWVSGAAILLAGYLAIRGFTAAHRL